MKNITKYWLVIVLLGTLLTACAEQTTPIPPVVTSPTSVAVKPTVAVVAPTVGNVPTVAVVTTTIQPTIRPEPTLAPPVTVTPTALPEPTILPAPTALVGKIAFNNLNDEIFIINTNNRTQTKIGKGNSPIFSPDGKRVGFINSLRPPTMPGGVRISTMNVDGSDQQQTCDIDGSGSYRLVRWSPRGSTIAVNASFNSVGNIYSCSVTEKAAPLLKAGQANVNGLYDWTSDNKLVVWQTGSQITDLQLYVGETVNAGKPLTTGQYRTDEVGFKYYRAARFSPDGKSLAIVGEKLFVLSVPGQISPYADKVINNLSKPIRVVWSPDNKTLAVTDYDEATKQFNLKLVDLATGNVTPFVEKVGPEIDWTRQ